MILLRSAGFHPWTQDHQGTLNSRKPWWMRAVLAVAFDLKIARVKLRAPNGHNPHQLTHKIARVPRSVDPRSPGYPEIGENLYQIWKSSWETKVPKSPGYPGLSKLRFFQDRQGTVVGFPSRVKIARVPYQGAPSIVRYGRTVLMMAEDNPRYCFRVYFFIQLVLVM